MKNAGPILVTGFEPFGFHKSNPSADLLPHLQEVHGNNMETLVLPVVWDVASETMLEKLKTGIEPVAIVMFGLAAARKGIHLESQAKNRAGFLQPDNKMRVKLGKKLDVNERAYLESTAPIDMIHESLSEAGIDTTISSDAGSYICNQLYFDVLKTVKDAPNKVPAVFVHTGKGLKGAELERASRIVVQTLIENSQT